MVNNRAKRKAEKQTLLESGEWTRCMFFNTHKRRHCNQIRASESEFCTHHKPDTNGTRMPCPLDPAHSIAKADLAKHLKICNKHHDIKATESLPFYSLNINSGDHPPSEQQQHHPLSDLVNEKTLPAFISKIEASYQQYFESNGGGGIKESIVMHSKVQPLYDEKLKQNSGDNVLRHIKQQGSIVSQVLFQPIKSPTLFLELGAGRGELSFVLSTVLKEQEHSVVLLDRAKCRRKADSRIRENVTDVERVTIDLRHFDFIKFSEKYDESIIAYSKHLCGVATDLSLRALSSEKTKVVKRIAVALCCHHKCTWEDYVNQSFFTSRGFTSTEFQQMVRMSSWGTCGKKKSTENERFVPSDLESIGRKCKRLIDAGRVEYLKSYYADVELHHYCLKKDSLENCMLVAREKC